MATTNIVLTAHVIEAYRIYYPDASRRDIYEALDASDPITPDILLTLLGRPAINKSRANSTYRIHPERSGIFCLATSEREEGMLAAVTFFRIYSFDQFEHAVQLCGPPTAFTADATFAQLALQSIQQDFWGSRRLRCPAAVRRHLSDAEIRELSWRPADAEDLKLSPLADATHTTFVELGGTYMKLFLHRGTDVCTVYLAGKPRDEGPTAAQAYPRLREHAMISPSLLHALREFVPGFGQIAPEKQEAWVRTVYLPKIVDEVRPGALRYTDARGFELWLVQIYRACWAVHLTDFQPNEDVVEAVRLLYTLGYVRWAPRVAGTEDPGSES